MANYTFVCFACRQAARRDHPERAQVRCPRCRAAMTFVGSRARIPAGDRPDDWHDFRAEFERRMAAKQAQFRDGRLFWLKALETQIRKLEDRPASPGRLKAIKQLRRQLERLKAVGVR